MSTIPFPQKKRPKKPRGLPKAASAMWDNVLDTLGESVTSADAEALATMCRWYGILDAMLGKLEKMSPDHDDYYRLQVLAGQASSHFTKLSNKFGLNPTDRKRIGKPKSKSNDLGARKRA